MGEEALLKISSAYSRRIKEANCVSDSIYIFKVATTRLSDLFISTLKVAIAIEIAD